MMRCLPVLLLVCVIGVCVAGEPAQQPQPASPTASPAGGNPTAAKPLPKTQQACEPFLRLDSNTGTPVGMEDPDQAMCLVSRPVKGLDGSCPACPVPSCGGCAPTCCYEQQDCCITDHDTGSNCCDLQTGGSIVCQPGKHIHYTTGPCGDGPPSCPARGIQSVFCE